MSEPYRSTQPELSPTGEPAAPDHVGLAFRAIAAGTLAGVAFVAAMMWTYRALQASGTAPPAPTAHDPIVNLVLFGWLGGAAAGALAAWVVMRPLASAYRRGGLAMVAGFASLLVSFVTAPVDSLFGRPGLLVLAATTGGLAWWVARAAARRHGQR
ncbi:MAG: hypothetical protein IPI92_06510 [Gemmatimonadetes bacterium]|jgi:hypothetical protein|nr:hypothetical protein [Gemmatimonadota bacterium]MBK7349500.1 hypothetical protein [Gemmatimonadota bacterium]MBK7784130.1 hypothetical protein [Gemmatimonadota bacterium]MBK9693242.1 hypothetical protein [Gemmatimonadota bacterium]MBP9201228.1 hypothetical protein [Gemmatimonadales bacterium]